MDEVLSKIRNIYIKEFVGPNIMECAAGSTGTCGGDTGHGGRTYFSIENISSTDLRIRVTDANGNIHESDDVSKVEIGLGGDWENKEFINALAFAVEIYEKKNANNIIPSKIKK